MTGAGTCSSRKLLRRCALLPLTGLHSPSWYANQIPFPSFPAFPPFPPPTLATLPCNPTELRMSGKQHMNMFSHSPQNLFTAFSLPFPSPVSPPLPCLTPEVRMRRSENCTSIFFPFSPLHLSLPFLPLFPPFSPPNKRQSPEVRMSRSGGPTWESTGASARCDSMTSRSICAALLCQGQGSEGSQHMEDCLPRCCAKGREARGVSIWRTDYRDECARRAGWGRAKGVPF